MLFKYVMCKSDLEQGKKYINVDCHKIYTLVGYSPFNQLYTFANTDDEYDCITLSLDRALKCFRKIDFTTDELALLLCSSMMDFIEIMVANKINKGVNDNGK